MLAARVLSTLKDRWLVHHHIRIFRKVIATRPSAYPGFEIVRHEPGDPAVADLYRKWRRNVGDEQIRQRFERGSRFYTFQKRGEPIASTWIVCDGRHFVDELGLFFPVAADELWQRDTFVLPGFRKRWVYGDFLDNMLARVYPQARVTWADINAENSSSIRAVTKYGHEPVADFQAFHCMRRVLFRSEWPVRAGWNTGYRVDKRLLYTGAAYWKYIEDHMV
jgi:hypothetical protein